MNGAAALVSLSVHRWVLPRFRALRMIRHEDKSAAGGARRRAQGRIV